LKSNTAFGILLGFVCIFGAYVLEGGSYQSLLILPAIIIVIGGTFAAVIAGSSIQEFVKIPRLMLLAFSSKNTDIDNIINQVTSFSAMARKDGVLALDQRIPYIENLFLRKLIQVAVDGGDENTVRNVAETEMAHMSERHNSNIGLFTRMGGYSPTMGIIGTVMGLISTLAAAGGDPSELIRHIATAFIATLWGIFMANIVWFPISDKLKSIHSNELQINQVIFDGVYGMVAGETPSVVRARMLSFYPLSIQEQKLSKKIIIDAGK